MHDSSPKVTIERTSLQLTADLPPNRTAGLLKVSWSDFARVGTLLALFIAGLLFFSPRKAEAPTEPLAVVQPMFALFALVAVVWLLMVVFRNVSLIRGLVSPEYYRAYQHHEPPEWIERPARAFNNLLQVPSLFYVVCLLMLVTRRLDQAQLFYCWVFVGTRWLHALIYILWNPLPYRFASWVMGCITLGILWVRLALLI